MLTYIKVTIYHTKNKHTNTIDELESKEKSHGFPYYYFLFHNVNEVIIKIEFIFIFRLHRCPIRQTQLIEWDDGEA